MAVEQCSAETNSLVVIRARNRAETRDIDRREAAISNVAERLEVYPILLSLGTDPDATRRDQATRIVDAVQAIASGVPDRHWVEWDEPSATSRRLQRTVCSVWVAPREVVLQRAQVTCQDCLAELAAADKVEL